MSLLKDFEWRHAAKAYDPTKKISQEDLNSILEAARLAPTSSGMQPFRVLVIENQELKEKLKAGSLNPDCMVDCSHILVFAAWTDYTNEKVDEMYNKISDERDQPRGRYDRYTDRLKEHLSNQTREEHHILASRQSYLGLGFALAQAATLRIDSTPAEGFDHDLIDEVLNLKEMGLKSVTLLYLGYSDAERDWLKPMKKVRTDFNDFVIYPQ